MLVEPEGQRLHATMAYTPETPLRIGIIGAGGIVKQRHLPALKAMPEVRITAVANTSLKSSEAFIAEHAPGAKAFERWEDLACSKDVDVVPPKRRVY